VLDGGPPERARPLGDHVHERSVASGRRQADVDAGERDGITTAARDDDGDLRRDGVGDTACLARTALR
jgi:hypothetical protein